MYDISLLKKLRKENGLTNQQLAGKLHLDPSTYAYYERGHTKISIDTLIQLAHLYQVSLADLLGEPPAAELNDASAFDDSAARFSQLNRDEQKLVILYRSGNSVQREALLAGAQKNMQA